MLIGENPYLTGNGGQPGNPAMPSWYQRHQRELSAFGPEASMGQSGTASSSVRDSGNDFGALDIGPLGRGAMMAAGFAGLPGVGLVGAGLNANNIAANNAARSALGMDQLSFGQTLGGLLGLNSYGRGLAPGVANHPMLDQWSYTGKTPVLSQGFVSPYGGTPAMDFFGALNDMNNIGRLGEVLSQLDQARAGGAGTNGTAEVNTTGNNPEFGADNGDVY